MPAAANRPGAALRNRAASPLLRISVLMAAWRVASGVFPPGLVQYPFAAIAPTSSLHVSAVPVSASTFAAAARALSFPSTTAVSPAAGGARSAASAFAARCFPAAVSLLFAFVAMRVSRGCPAAGRPGCDTLARPAADIRRRSADVE